MRIVDGRVNWRDMWANRPEIELLVDRMMPIGEHVFSEREGMFYAERDGDVCFLLDNPDRSGFGGKTFRLRMEGGAERILVGPWSSRAGVANRLGFGPCLDVALADSRGDWNSGCLSFGHCSLGLALGARPIIRMGDGFNGGEGYFRFPVGSSLTLVRCEESGEVRYEPAVRMRDGKLWVKPGLRHAFAEVAALVGEE